MKAKLLPMACCAILVLTAHTTETPRYVFVWAGDAEKKSSDFLTVLDVTPQYPTYGHASLTHLTFFRPSRSCDTDGWLDTITVWSHNAECEAINAASAPRHRSEEDGPMPKYLMEASYTTEGAKGLAKEGGSSRRKAIDETLKGLGGKVEAFYFAFGTPDVYLIIDVPDAVTAAAVSLAVNQSGAVQLKSHVLMSPEEMDQAAKKAVSYRAPGR
jgi:uncharacterized protein with GYD domain